MRNYRAVKPVLILVASSMLVLARPIAAQEKQAESGYYLWPTDASRYLTSAFSEYRGRRYHAGIDVKTWGRIGYKVFAIRPGYVWRISVSPYGYGKSIYLKLDTGEIAQYAHLSGYSDKIQEVVEAEQQRTGKYRLNKFLKPGEIPVAQGEVIGRTGQTGIGAPHLHFEIRDSGNRPINPLSKGYKLPDRVRPIITKVSLTPLDASSEVNGDYTPIVLRPDWLKPGEYTLAQAPTIWGNVGIAVSCYDKDSNSSNLFGLYSFKLYVDDVLRFQYAFDELSFQKNEMVELERDYRLYRRGQGRFHKLYKDRHNTKSNYKPNRTWAGVLSSVSLIAKPNLHSGRQREHDVGALFPGNHEFRIEVSDFNGNMSSLRGKFQVGESYEILPVISDSEDGNLILQNLLTYDLRQIENVEVTALIGNRWRPLKFSSLPHEGSLEEKGGEAAVTETVEALNASTLSIEKPTVNPLILKIVARDQFQRDSYPHIYLSPKPGRASGPPQLTVAYDYYDEYVRLQIDTKNLLDQVPKVTLYPGRADSALITLHQLDLRKYVGRIPFNTLSGNAHKLRITTQSPNGDSFSSWQSFAAQEVEATSSGRMSTKDGSFWVDFWPGSLYDSIYGRITKDSLTSARDITIIGMVYDAEPQDAALKQGAKVTFRYSGDGFDPQRLGVYYKTRKGKWALVDNKLDRARRTVSAKVFSLEKFALIQDDVPPEITNVRPRFQVRLTSPTPRISASVRDKLSGFESENDIVIRLDGNKLIAEYDPERNRVFYQVKNPLAKGRHELSFWARDRSGNESLRESSFWID